MVPLRGSFIFRFDMMPDDLGMKTFKVKENFQTG